MEQNETATVRQIDTPLTRENGGASAPPVPH